MQSLSHEEERRLLEETYTATVHHLPLDELKQRAAWIFSKYVDEEGVRRRVDPMPDGAAVAAEVKADKMLTWHP